MAFQEAATCWLDQHAIEVYAEEHSDRETRWLVIGRSDIGRLLTCGYTERQLGKQEVVRLIGARLSTSEGRVYIMKQKTNGKNRDLEIPEIPANAKLRPLHCRPAKNARLPQEQVKLQLEKHIITWFRHEAQRQKREADVFINAALRRFIIQRVGGPEFQTGGLNPTQRAEVQMLVSEMLAQARIPRLVAVN